MTIIAYRNNSIASDSAVINGYGSVMGSFQKCGARQIGDKFYFFGATGELAYCNKFMNWCNGDGLVNHLAGEDDIPLIDPPGDKEYCTGIVCWDDQCRRFEGNSPAIPMTGEFFFLGSGDMYVAGAMAHGADVYEALKIGLRLDSLSGGKIYHYEVHGGELHHWIDGMPA